ncbi:phage tail protein [Bacteroides sp.]|uniref:phage tail protein n=1 Tax=Bacteroides sp. TaxID=29523 RepID=UPI0026316FC4|nr:phage tail protein [Bacteroides sp.]MDD3039752.1 phage tail protein [Bacteroides sp.]
MFIETITYAADKVKESWVYLETIMPATINEWNRILKLLIANNNLIQGLLDLKAPIEPPGIIKFYAAPVEPDGYLFCRGQVVSRTTYAGLFAAIGTIYGAGDGSTTFKIPDLRGVFIRGLGGNSADLGVVQGDAIRNITGRFGADDRATGLATGAFRGAQQWEVNTTAQGGDNAFFEFSFDASRVVPTAEENRPVNMAMNYIIKY